MDKKIEPTDAMVEEALFQRPITPDTTRAILRIALNHPDARGLFAAEGNTTLPTEDGAVIVSNGGHKRIEARVNGHTYYAHEALLLHEFWWGAWRTDTGGLVRSAVFAEHITPGTWKVADQ